MQKERLQCTEFLTVADYGTVVRQCGDVALPDKFAGRGDDGYFLANSLHSLEHVAGDETVRPALVKWRSHCFIRETPAGSMLERLVEKEPRRIDHAAAKATRFAFQWSIRGS